MCTILTVFRDRRSLFSLLVSSHPWLVWFPFPSPRIGEVLQVDQSTFKSLFFLPLTLPTLLFLQLSSLCPCSLLPTPSSLFSALFSLVCPLPCLSVVDSLLQLSCSYVLSVSHLFLFVLIKRKGNFMSYSDLCISCHLVSCTFPSGFLNLALLLKLLPLSLSYILPAFPKPSILLFLPSTHSPLFISAYHVQCRPNFFFFLFLFHQNSSPKTPNSNQYFSYFLLFIISMSPSCYHRLHLLIACIAPSSLFLICPVCITTLVFSI